MNKSRIVASVLYGLFAAFVIINSLRMPIVQRYGLGHGFLPLAIGVMMAALSISWFISSLLEEETAENGSRFVPDRESVRRVLILIAIALVYAGTLQLFGFLVSALVMFVLVVFFLQRKRGRKALNALAFFAVVTAFVYLVFDVWIGVAFPKGMVGFL